VIGEPGASTPYIYFPTTGFISLIAQTDEGASIEVGMVGKEGMVGSHIALGVAATPLRSLVQGAGTALRMSSAHFRQELADSAALRGVMGRYLYVLMSQLAVSSACLRFHQVGPRLARWLLMSHDRARSDAFLLTQEFLSYMLGVRRVSVTAAAGILQQQGLITYSRGNLVVIDRAGLEAAACACYDKDRAVYARTLGREAQ
jgi:CRP-like cAMP-binding protein